MKLSCYDSCLKNKTTVAAKGCLLHLDGGHRSEQRKRQVAETGRIEDSNLHRASHPD